MNEKRHKFRPVRYLITLIIIGFAISIFLPQITTLENSVSVLRSMSVWLVCLAALAQVSSYLGSGYLLKVIVNLEHSPLSIARGVLITLSSASIGLLPGGWVTATAAVIRWIRKSKDTTEEAGLAGVLPPLFSNAVLVIVTIIGLVNLLIKHQLSSAQLIAYSLILSILGLGILVVIYGIKHQEKVERLILGSVSFLMRLMRRTYDVTPIRNTIDSSFSSLRLLRNRGWIKPALGAGINIGFDMLTLYLLFIAAGHAASLGVLIAGYSLAFLLGRDAIFVPGGIGVIEGGMIAIYMNLGIPGPVSVVVILSYRLFSFWIPSLLGFVVMGYLEKTSK